MLRSGKGIFTAFKVAGCTGKAAEVEVSGPLDAVAESFGVRESPEGRLGTGIFKLIRGMMAHVGSADGVSPCNVSSWEEVAPSIGLSF